MNQTGRSENSKNEIIHAGMAEFSEYGPDKASLNKICRENGISKGKFYHHFASKEELFCACIRHAIAELASDIQEFTFQEGRSFQENLHDYYVARIDYWIAHPDDYNVVKLAINNTNTDIDKEIRSSIKLYDDAVLEKLLSILQHANLPSGLAEENFSRSFANIVRVINEGLFFPDMVRIISAVRQNNPESVKRRKQELITLYDKFIDILLHGILPREESGKDREA